MTTERIDVLAVMAREETMRRRNANRELARGNGDKWDQFWKRAEHIKEARAAVAELIEAANLCAEAFCDYLDDEVPGVVAKSYPAVTNLRAALARVGGA